MNYIWSFNFLFNYKTALISGLIITFKLIFYSLFFGTLLGLFLGILKYEKKFTFIISIFVEIFRNLPVLVLLIWFFYAMPILINITFSPFITSIIVFSLNLAAFSTDIFRSGLQSIKKGQIESAKILGLNKFQIYRYILLPQSIKLILPSLTGRFIETIKFTALAALISVPELFFVGQDIMVYTFRPLEVYTIIALLYFIIIFPLSFYLKRYENYVTN